jgi:hypothetical protein
MATSVGATSSLAIKAPIMWPTSLRASDLEIKPVCSKELVRRMSVTIEAAEGVFLISGMMFSKDEMLLIPYRRTPSEKVRLHAKHFCK